MLLTLRLLAVSLLLPTASLAQQLVPATGEFRVNQNVPSDQYQPQIAIGPLNDYIVVWKSWMQDDNTASIYFRRYNSAHIALSSELLVATGSSYQEEYVVKVLYWDNGKYIIAWNDGTNVNMRVLNTDNTMSATVPIASNSQWDIAVRGNTLAILWGSGNAELYIRGYDLGTNSFIAPAVLVTEDATNDYDHPNVRFRNDGSMVTIYGRGNYPNRIYRKTFDTDFLAQINETLVYDQNSSLNCIDVSTNASDEILISTKWGVNGTDVYKAWVLDANGTAIVDNLGVYSCAYAYYTAECTLFDNGDFVIVMGNWLSLNDPESYNVRGIYYRNYNFQNTGVVVMNTTLAQAQNYPAVEKRSDGGFVVVWQGNGFQGDTQGINARVWSGATFPGLEATSNAITVVDETGTSQQLQLRLGTQPTGNVVVDLLSSNTAEASIDVAQMTFTTTNWDQPQTVTVTGLDDSADDGDMGLSVVGTMNVLTADAQYAAMPAKYFPVINRDDDATFTVPQPPAFCRDQGMPGANVIITNAGQAITGMQAASSDQSVVNDADITVTPVNTSTYAISIGTLPDNVPGTCQITVTATDGLFTYTDVFTVTSLGQVPMIIPNGSDLECSTTGVAYQWYVDGAFINGATQQTWTPTQNGDYSILVVDADGCYNTSDPYTYLSTGVGMNAAATGMVATLTDVLTLTAPHSGRLRMVDATGRVLIAQRVTAGTQTIAMPGLASGAYMLLLDDDAVVKVVKD